MKNKVVDYILHQKGQMASLEDVLNILNIEICDVIYTKTRAVDEIEQKLVESADKYSCAIERGEVVIYFMDEVIGIMQ